MEEIKEENIYDNYDSDEDSDIDNDINIDNLLIGEDSKKAIPFKQIQLLFKMLY